MQFTKLEANGVLCALVNSEQPVITDVQSALDLLMSANYEAGTKNILLSKKLVTEEFFILSTGLAGEILQKFINYGGRIAIYGDYSHYTSKPLRDFIYESNQGKDVFFVPSLDAAVKRLTEQYPNGRCSSKAAPMVIRTEQPSDYEAVYQVVQAAFENAEHSDGREQELVNALRESSAFVPDLSLVAERNGTIVGHILFTKLQIHTHTALALAPLSVLPSCQRQGVGASLIREGHRIAQQLGYSYSVVLGSETYYPRMGYLPAETFNIYPCFEVPSKNFMAYKLSDDAPAISGTVRYAAEFGLD